MFKKRLKSKWNLKAIQMDTKRFILKMFNKKKFTSAIKGVEIFRKNYKCTQQNNTNKICLGEIVFLSP